MSALFAHRYSSIWSTHLWQRPRSGLWRIRQWRVRRYAFALRPPLPHPTPPTFPNSNGNATEKGGYSVREQLPLPTKPPYTVHLGNMSFDATEGDIQDFFRECSVTNVRIVEDKAERKPKGFGYAEFSSLEGIKKALTFNNTQFQGRNIRVSVAEPRKFILT